MADLMAALRNADAAGDTEAATRIAAMIRAQQAAPVDTVPQQEPGLLDQVGRQLGLTGRYALEGAGNLVGMVTDPFTQFVPGMQPMGTSATAAANALGLPEPQGKLEKDIGAASRALVSTGLTGGLGGAAGAAELAAQPGTQAASAILGGVGQEEGGPLGGLLGSLVPGVPYGLTGASKAILRGGGEAAQQRMADNLAQFEAAGTTPTVGQATEGGFARMLEGILAKVPGGSGVMAKKAVQQSDELGKGVTAAVEAAAPGVDPTQAGITVQQGITGQGGFLDRFKEQSKALYDAVDDKLPNGTAGTTVGVPATVSTLYRLTKPIAGAEKTSGLLADPKIAAIADALNQDVRGSVVAGGKASLPYDAIKNLRSRVGDKIADAGLAPDVSTRQLKQLYGALSEDMRNGLKDASPEAFAANNAAENFVRNGHAQIDKLESIVGKAGGPEAVFKAATAGTREGATTLNQVMSALQPEEQKVVTGAIVKRLGQANASAQNAEGDVFSPQTFLTNWNKLSQPAKQVLFQSDPETMANLEQVAKVTSNLREGAKALPNSSNTASAALHGGTATAAALAAISGNLPALAGIGATTGAANMGARLMTNPDFVRWLARNASAPVGVLPGQIGYLSQLGNQNQNPDLALAAHLIGSGNTGLPQ